MKRLLMGMLLLYGLSCPLWADELAQGFLTPPASAKPDIWWHWMDGSITKEGITADLEAMQRVGIGSAQIFNLKASPPGPVKFLGPEWHALMKHAGQEAERLGLKLSAHNCAGWSSSGGPWITPENAMQRVTISETNITGPAHFSGVLPQPPTLLDFYRDIAVLAFRAPVGEDVSMPALSPNVTASVSNINGACLFDDKASTFVTLPWPGRDTPQFIQMEFAQPVAARSVRLKLVQGIMDVRGMIQVSDDGQAFRAVTSFAFPHPGASGELVLSLGNEPVRARFYRIKFTVGGLVTRHLCVAEISLSSALRIGDIEAKSGMNDGRLMPGFTATSGAVPDDLVVKREGILDLSTQMKAKGPFDWDVPPGRWTILRMGHTPIGKVNREPATGGNGLECDKLNSAALDAHWAGYVQKILDDLGPLAGKDKTFNNLLIDSYEIGGQNWTPKFRAEFLRRRGYDLRPYLATLTGRVVDSPEISERFLWDLRRTIADLFAEKYYGHFKKLCNERGLTSSIEPYTGPFESLQCGAAADIPMGEFWIGNFYNSVPTTKLAASVGHIYGRTIIGAESFTSAPSDQHGRWLDDPYALKATGDLVFCNGVNRYSLHRFAMQPWTNRWPGMAMGPWGTYFDRTVTWFEQGRAWLQYVARCQYLLQQGRFIADAAYFYGENAPVESLPNDPALPPGYDFDGINADVLLNQATVENGRLTLKSGMSYRVLVLPPSARTMTPILLRKLREFVADGLTVVGAPLAGSPSLQDYPQCDREVQTLAAELWGKCDGQAMTEHSFGKGKVIWGQPMLRVLAGLNASPDFEFKSSTGSQLTFTHRLADGADIYFVSNQRDQFDAADCTFRVSGKAPELWYPDSGRMIAAAVWREQDGRTTVPLQFDPAGSVFVVFRKQAGTADHLTTATFSVAEKPTPPSPQLVIRCAIYEALDGSGSLDVTAKLNSMVRNGTLRVEAGNAVIGEDPARFRPKQLRVEYELNGKVEERITAEEKYLEIGAAPGANKAPDFTLVVDADGETKLHVSAAGVLEGQTAFGKNVKLEVRDVPAPREVNGLWEVNFPPNWGAPAQIHLPKLISWSEHENSGVKYFSGTATYVKDVEIPAEWLTKGLSLWLDLGRLKNLAEVMLNGKALGVLWKPPFRVNITDAAQPGKNKLEIRVTNLWPNRLIGDEQLPSDREWGAAKQLKSWPPWLWEGKPSPTGRLTFTTWHHWKKDDALLPSGLLGPVTIRAAVEVLVK